MTRILRVFMAEEWEGRSAQMRDAICAIAIFL